MQMVTELDQSDEAAIRELLLFHRITEVDCGENDWDDGMIVLDNGTVLIIKPNDGCGGCPSGSYSITELNGCDNVITHVELVREPDEEYCEGDKTYSIFVYAENKRLKLLEVSGDDGNGYYGTGYKIEVTVCTE